MISHFHATTAHGLLAKMGYDWHWRFDDDALLTAPLKLRQEGRCAEWSESCPESG